jgi:hypothetical protein
VREAQSAFGSGMIPYIIKSLYFMIPCAFPVLQKLSATADEPFRGQSTQVPVHEVLAPKDKLFWSSPVKPGQTKSRCFFEPLCPSLDHSNTLSIHLCLSISEPKATHHSDSIFHYANLSRWTVPRQGRGAATPRSAQRAPPAKN